MKKWNMNIEIWKYNYNLVKREFWCVLGVIFIFVICCFIRCNSSLEANENFFNEAIEEYETNTGIKIYPYGRECLKKATIHCKNKEEVYQIIIKNEKWFR